MAFVIKDRVKETCSAPGTGTVTLLGAASGYASFSTVGDGNSTYYCIADQGGSNWEVGIGTYTASGTTFSRDTVLSNSLNTTAKINFSSGTQDIFCTYPAERAVDSNVALTNTRVPFVNADGQLTDSANLTFNGTDLQVGSQGDVRFGDSDNSNYVAFQSPATVATNVTWTLPSADGTLNQALVTNGSAVLSWATLTTSPAGSDTQVQFNNSGVFGASANLTFNGTTLSATDIRDTSLTSGRVTYATTGGSLTDSANLTFDGSNLTLGAQGDVRFADSDSSNWVAFQGPATVGTNVTWTLPSVDGTNGQALVTNGTGTLSWSTAGVPKAQVIAFAMILGL